MSSDIKFLGSFVWSIAETLRGDFKQSEYGKVILPFVVLRRLDCILEATKPAVLDMASSLPADMDDDARDTLLSGVVGQDIKLYNLSRFTFATLKGQDSKDIHKNLIDYITKFSPNVRDVFLDKFLFTDQLKRLNDAGLLFRVFDQFTQIDLHPEAISNLEMGYLFEELIRRFSEISNETAGEHYTPREVIRLIVSLLLANDKDALTGSGVIRQIYDPAAGTGGMLSIAEMQMKELKRSLRQGLVTQRGIITSAYDAVEVLRGNDPRFWFYSLLALDLAKHYYSLGGGVRQSVKFSDFPNDWVYRPDLATQRQIADFLDRETARIDLLIEKKQRLVALLGERLNESLQAVVLGEAQVQRGNDGDWLTGLSSEWRFIPLKHFVSSMGGATPSKDREDYWDGDIPWVSPKDMKTDLIVDVPDHVSKAALSGSALALVPKGSVLMVVRGMILARYVPVCRLGVEATINQDMKALIPTQSIMMSEYLQLMLQGFSNVLMTFVEEAAHGTKKLRSDQLFNMKFPVPPIDTQKKIVTAHLIERARNTSLRDKTNASLDRLKEYRSALITAAVTGQIDISTYAKSGTPDRRLDAIQEEMGA